MVPVTMVPVTMVPVNYWGHSCEMWDSVPTDGGVPVFGERLFTACFTALFLDPG